MTVHERGGYVNEMLNLAKLFHQIYHVLRAQCVLLEVVPVGRGVRERLTEQVVRNEQVNGAKRKRRFNEIRLAR